MFINECNIYVTWNKNNMNTIFLISFFYEEIKGSFEITFSMVCFLRHSVFSIVFSVDSLWFTILAMILARVFFALVMLVFVYSKVFVVR